MISPKLWYTSFPCPGCGAPCSASDYNTPIVTHAEPTCAMFDKLETVTDGADFMRAARAKYFPESFD